MAHDVFVSYSSKDKTIADAVCARLEARGIRCWIAPRDVQPGLPYGEAIIDGIHNCQIMVLLLSSNANSSGHIPKEVERAVSQGATIIPLRIEAVTPAKSLDYFIGSVHWLDALTPPLERHLDNLADTILKILPSRAAAAAEAAIKAAPVVTRLPASAATFSAPQRAAKKWLVPTIVGAAVVAVVAAAILAGVVWSGSGSVAGGSTAGGVTVIGGGGANPAGNASRSRSPGSSGSRPASTSTGLGADPMIGCWTWFNNAPAVISSNGTMTAGSFTARWRRVDAARGIYTITWPEAVDATTLSPDGMTLAGGNQYGFRMSATRLSGGPGIAGSWRWFNGAPVMIRDDGTFIVGTIIGRWHGSGLSYNLIWPNPVDTVTLSADRTRVEGSNQYGIRITGTKMGSCGGG